MTDTHDDDTGRPTDDRADPGGPDDGAHDTNRRRDSGVGVPNDDDDRDGSTRRVFAEELRQLRLSVGERVTLESLREPVVPDTLMLEPFLDLPANVRLVDQSPLDEDGVVGAAFHLEATDSGTGTATVGFRDESTGTPDRTKTIDVRVD